MKREIKTQKFAKRWFELVLKNMPNLSNSVKITTKLHETIKKYFHEKANKTTEI